MSAQHVEVWAPMINNGVLYGHEWTADGFDKFADAELAKIYAAYHGPLVAVDIGCGTGQRASALSSLGLFDEIIAIDFTDRTEDIEIAWETAAHSLVTGPRRAAPIRFERARAQDLSPEFFKGAHV